MATMLPLPRSTDEWLLSAQADTAVVTPKTRTGAPALLGVWSPSWPLVLNPQPNALPLPATAIAC